MLLIQYRRSTFDISGAKLAENQCRNLLEAIRILGPRESVNGNPKKKKVSFAAYLDKPMVSQTDEKMGEMKQHPPETVGACGPPAQPFRLPPENQMIDFGIAVPKFCYGRFEAVEYVGSDWRGKPTYAKVELVIFDKDLCGLNCRFGNVKFCLLRRSSVADYPFI